MNEIPFKGATRKVIKREFKFKNIKCDCGMLEFVFTATKAWHLPDCIINNPKKNKRRRKRK